VIGDEVVHCSGYETSVPPRINVVLKFVFVENPSFVLGYSDNVKAILKLTPPYIA
jgi:hypothetical protein